MDKQRRLQATSAPAVAGSMNVAAGSVVQDDGLNIKEEWADADMDIGPTVLQHMDAPYSSVQTVERKYPSFQQVVTLVILLEDNVDVATNKFTTIHGRIKQNDTWDLIAEKLNSIGSGAVKGPDKWKQTWRDLKANAKKKATRIKQSRSRTGGGPTDNNEFTEVENFFLNIIGPAAIFGADDVVETVVGVQTAEVPTMKLDIDVLPEPSVDLGEGTSASPGLQATPVVPGVAHNLPWHKGKKRRPVNLDEKLLDIEKERLSIERERMEIEKAYKSRKMDILERLALDRPGLSKSLMPVTDDRHNE